jgi:hypothetical protein
LNRGWKPLPQKLNLLADNPLLPAARISKNPIAQEYRNSEAGVGIGIAIGIGLSAHLF